MISELDDNPYFSMTRALSGKNKISAFYLIPSVICKSETHAYILARRPFPSLIT